MTNDFAEKVQKDPVLQDICQNFLNPLEELWPELTEKKAEIYCRHLRGVSHANWRAAADKIIETHKTRSFPTVAECMSAVRTTRNERDVTREAIRAQEIFQQQQAERPKRPLKESVEDGIREAVRREWRYRKDMAADKEKRGPVWKWYAAEKDGCRKDVNGFIFEAVDLMEKASNPSAELERLLPDLIKKRMAFLERRCGPAIERLERMRAQRAAEDKKLEQEDTFA
jgi:valyl-tRNA synthetase